ncbi:MAG: hypothetical protein MRJ92_07720 [Nitrospira sp.]|nr:hypothetical protein [Nitrospira sp.]
MISRPSTSMLFDLAFGIMVMGTVGALIGTFLGSASIPVTSGVGVLLGAVVGFLGGRRFLSSILVGTVLGGLLAWMIAGLEKVSFGAGAGAAMGAFSACRFRCCWMSGRRDEPRRRGR